MWEENLETQAGVHLIEGVRLIWGLLNTGFTLRFWLDENVSGVVGHNSLTPWYR